MRDAAPQRIPSAPGASAERTGQHLPWLPRTSLRLLRFEDHADVFYTEDMIAGHMTANPETFKEASLHYAHLQASALSVRDSVALIARVMEEHYGEHNAVA